MALLQALQVFCYTAAWINLVLRATPLGCCYWGFWSNGASSKYSFSCLPKCLGFSAVFTSRSNLHSRPRKDLTPAPNMSGGWDLNCQHFVPKKLLPDSSHASSVCLYRCWNLPVYGSRSRPVWAVHRAGNTGVLAATKQKDWRPWDCI